MRNQVDPSLYVLSEYEQALFDRFKSAGEVMLTAAEFKVLREKGLVAGAMDGKSDWFEELPQQGKCRLSPTGKILKNYQIREEKRQLRDDAYRRREEIRGWITTIIAVLAFLLSIASLSWQAYTWIESKQESTVAQSIVAPTTKPDVRSFSLQPGQSIWGS